MDGMEKICARHESNPGFASATFTVHPAGQLEAICSACEVVSFAFFVVQFKSEIISSRVTFLVQPHVTNPSESRTREVPPRCVDVELPSGRHCAACARQARVSPVETGLQGQPEAHFVRDRVSHIGLFQVIQAYLRRLLADYVRKIIVMQVGVAVFRLAAS